MDKSNYIHYKVCDENIYPFLNFNDTIIVWDEITNPFLNFNGCTVNKRGYMGIDYRGWYEAS